MRPGWLQRQAEQIRRITAAWPRWMIEAAKDDDLRRRRRESDGTEA